MDNKIKIGIVGYGNLGKGSEIAISQNPDMKLVGIFTRRDPSLFESKDNIYHIDRVLEFREKIDVMILCGGSKSDLDCQCPMIAANFNTVDSFDNHGRIPEYFEKIDRISKASKTLSLISVGWDPGLFSLNRLLFQSILPKGKDYTFWGDGVSQGHSDAVRRVEGVKKAIQYTIPLEDCIEKVRNFEDLNLPADKTHKRVCYVVAKEEYSLDKIEKDIKTMPNYFDKYDTTVNFISEEDFNENHNKMNHGGLVLRTGTTNVINNQKMEFNLKLDSNSEFTSSVLVAYARAVYRMAREGNKGCITIFDIALKYLSTMSDEEMRRNLL